jgi:alkaline phosphatase D
MTGFIFLTRGFHHHSTKKAKESDTHDAHATQNNRTKHFFSIRGITCQLLRTSLTLDSKQTYQKRTVITDEETHSIAMELQLEKPRASSSATKSSRILFGSCNSQHYPQVLWPNIRSRNATAFVWGGDAIYADKTRPSSDSPKLFEPVITKHPGTPKIMRKLYLDQLAHPEYSELLKEVHVFGTVDDHDYGTDNGDVTFKYKREAAVEYVETFLRQDPGSAMAKRARSGAGVYAVKLYDFSRPVGQELLTDEEAGIDPDVVSDEATAYSNRSVAVFVIDIRSHKTPYSKHYIKKFKLDYDGDFLGESQWWWLKEGLSRSKASVNVIVNGLQVHSDKYSDPNVAEAWARFPTAQKRFYNLLMQSSAKMPILISGDVHHASLSRKDCTNDNEDVSHQPRSLMEMTTSGMTHSWNTHFCAAPSTTCRWWYTKLSARTCMTFGYFTNPWTEVITVKKGMEGAKSGLQYSLDLNFGELEFDWENRMVQARVMGVRKEPPLLSVQWKMDAASSFTGNTESSWECANYRGSVHPVVKVVGQLASVSLIVSFMCFPTVLALVVVTILFRWCFRSSSSTTKVRRS